MKKLIVFLLLLQLPFLLKAQKIDAPGYFGYKGIVSYSLYVMPRAGVFEFNGYSSVNGLLNLKHNLNVEYVLNTDKSLCGGIYLKQEDLYYINSFNYSYYEADYRPLNNENLKCLNIGLFVGVKKYKQNSITPLGKYRKVEAMFHLSKINYQNDRFFISPPGSYTSQQVTIGNGKFLYPQLVLAYSIGKQRVFFDKIAIDRGVRAGFSANGLISFLNYDSTHDFIKELKYATHRSVFFQQTINFYLLIGFLSF